MMVTVHAQGQIRVRLRLNFDVNEHPFLTTVPPPNLDEFVGALFAQVSVAHDLLKLLVEKLDGHSPIYSSRSERKAKHQEGLQVVLQRLLPRAVVINRFGHWANSNAETAPAKAETLTS